MTTPDLQTRSASFAPTSINEQARTAEIVWSTGAPVLRSSWDGEYIEELSMDPEHVRMGRLQSGRAPFLANHDGRSIDAVIGVIESARIENGRGIARVRFAKDDPAADAAWNKVRQGILGNVSVGYRVHKFDKIEGKTPVFRAIDWEPFEVSLVPMGADSTAQVRGDPSTPPRSSPHLEKQMNPEKTTDTLTAERERVAGILNTVRTSGLETSVAERMIADGTSLENARSLVLEKLAERNAMGPGENAQHIRVEAGSLGHEGVDDRIRTMAAALASRFGGPPAKGPAEQYVRLRVPDMARSLLEARGVSTRMMRDAQVISRSLGGLHSTSDLPALLTETGNRLLRNAYESAPAGVKALAKRVLAEDFRPMNKLTFSKSVGLQKVSEGAEIKRGSTLTESKLSYSIETYADITGISRQALISDDLSALAQFSQKQGRDAAEFEARKLVELLASNPTMGYDSVAMFHAASHGNLGTAGAISLTTLTEALKLMRLQTDESGNRINVSPKFLLVPPSLEIVAHQFTRQINATTAATVNPFSSQLQVIVDARLEDYSSTAWYLAADPGLIDGLEYAHLAGAEGPQLEMQEGWNVLGVEFRVVLDFGCAAIDHRGWLKNLGA
jgi:HK97 family phage prohead protease